jgi:hypothetical protein
VTTLDRWRDAPFLAFSKDGRFRAAVEREIHREKPSGLQEARDRSIDELFDKIERGEEPS